MNIFWDYFRKQWLFLAFSIIPVFSFCQGLSVRFVLFPGDSLYCKPILVSLHSIPACYEISFQLDEQFEITKNSMLSQFYKELSGSGRKILITKQNTGLEKGSFSVQNDFDSIGVQKQDLSRCKLLSQLRCNVPLTEIPILTEQAVVMRTSYGNFILEPVMQTLLFRDKDLKRSVQYDLKKGSYLTLVREHFGRDYWTKVDTSFMSDPGMEMLRNIQWSSIMLQGDLISVIASFHADLLNDNKPNSYFSFENICYFSKNGDYMYSKPFIGESSEVDGYYFDYDAIHSLDKGSNYFVGGNADSSTLFLGMIVADSIVVSKRYRYVYKSDKGNYFNRISTSGFLIDDNFGYLSLKSKLIYDCHTLKELGMSFQYFEESEGRLFLLGINYEMKKLYYIEYDLASLKVLVKEDVGTYSQDIGISSIFPNGKDLYLMDFANLQLMFIGGLGFFRDMLKLGEVTE